MPKDNFKIVSASELLENPPQKIFEQQTEKKIYPNKKTALMKATDLLAYQEQSSKVLKRKLTAKKYSETEIDDAIEKLKKYNYLNDEETCKRQFENFYSSGKMSVRQICAKLIQRGFDSDFVQKIIPEDTDEHEKKVAENFLNKKFGKINFDSLDSQEKFKIKSKIFQHLAAKGLNSEIISVAVENFIKT